jgi:hypothetical protein
MEGREQSLGGDARVEFSGRPSARYEGQRLDEEIESADTFAVGVRG